MKLIQARVRGLGPVVETDWFELSPKLNLFHFHNRIKGNRFFQALQTINPPFRCQKLAPFSDFPEHMEWHGFTRHVIPEKRTVALGVFAAPSELVIELGAISSLLYETDRIEVGRRLDYSRWSNFVELASSTRFSELEPVLTNFLNRTRNNYPKRAKEIERFIADFNPSDRINNERLETLKTMLAELGELLPQRFITDLKEIRTMVMRSEFFHAARRKVYQRLPLITLVPIAADHPENTPQSCMKKNELDLYIRDADLEPQIPIEKLTNLSGINRIKSQITLANRISRHLFHTAPILLFDYPAQNSIAAHRQEFTELLTETSSKYQCLCHTDDRDFFDTLPADKRYLANEIIHC